MKRLKGRRTILLGVVVGLALSGSLVYIRLTSAGGSPPLSPDPATGQHGPMIALDERVVNLKTGGVYRYAKIGVTVEIRPDDASFYALTADSRAAAETLAQKEHESSIPLLLDALGTVVSARTSTELDGVDGREKLKQDLESAMRGVLGDGVVLHVYFTDLVMQ
jgi:flagellar FliL protein